ncbi:MAG: GNAT family N-acetyltransferase [Bacteroidales bacterium]|jgi:diamine N-acetyltransferase|nr:GNAT family N-acetyltransferase [Bacteroidales bacterium]
MFGKKVYLRALEPSDLELLYQWENDISVWDVSDAVAPYSRFTLEQFIQSISQDIYAAKQLRLMINDTHTHQTVGIIDVFDIDPIHLRAGIGILIAQEYRQQGYAAEALQLTMEHLFMRLHLHQLYCNILSSNEASLKLFTNAGFVIAGLKKEWHLGQTGFEDEYLLQKINLLVI